MKIVENILDSMSIGSNCGTTASKIILNYYGYKLSEDMIFGLGSGLGFIYQYYAGDESYFLSGKNESLENNIANMFGGTVITGYFDGEEMAFAKVKDFLNKNMPVILDVSIRYLPYFKPYLESVGNIGFGLHNVVLIGYDEDEETVLLLDHRWNEPQKISMRDLARARGAADSGMNPRNAYRVYILPKSPICLADYIEYAIQINVSRMKYPFAYKMGLSGLKTFQNEIFGMLTSDKWPEGAEAISTFAVLMEKLGTGGGNFRRMYGRFLKEAAVITGRKIYHRTGEAYMSLAKEWKELYKELLAALLNNSPENRSRIQDRLAYIVEMEYALMEQLHTGKENYYENRRNLQYAASQIPNALRG